MNSPANARPESPIKIAFREQYKVVKGLVPDGMTANDLAQSFFLALANDATGKLSQCSGPSFGVAYRTAAKLGLPPERGLAYLVPYGSNVVLMPGYRGLIKCAKNSGEVVKVEAHVVWKGDFIEIERGTSPSITHRPTVDAVPDESEVRGVYAIAFMTDGTQLFEYLSRDQVNHIRDACSSGKSPAWANHYPEMARAKAVQRLGKFLPFESSAREAFDVADKADAGITIKPVEGSFLDDNPETMPATKSERLSDQLGDEPDEKTKAMADAAIANLKKEPAPNSAEDELRWDGPQN